MTERHESVLGQLLSCDPKNQNIPGLDAILRGEIMRKDALIAQLMNQVESEQKASPGVLVFFNAPVTGLPALLKFCNA